MNLNNVTPSKISVNGGRITINGVGLPETWPNSYYNEMSLSTNGKNIVLNIVSISTSSIVFQISNGLNAQ